MPWQLNTSVNVGDLDDIDYDQIRIMRMSYSLRSKQESIDIQFEYGRTVDNIWVPGILPKDKSNFVSIRGDDFVNFITTHLTNDGELTYNAVKRGLYEWLSDNGYIDSGTVI